MSSVSSVIRQQVKLDYDHTCQLCFQKYKSIQLEVHHIRPRSLKGGNEPENLLPLCGGNHTRNCHLLVHRHQIEFNKKKQRILYIEKAPEPKVINININVTIRVV
jgi:5-methylcytosine-specific restriction endonuclease McrA